MQKLVLPLKRDFAPVCWNSHGVGLEIKLKLNCAMVLTVPETWKTAQQFHVILFRMTSKNRSRTRYMHHIQNLESKQSICTRYRNQDKVCIPDTEIGSRTRYMYEIQKSGTDQGTCARYRN